MGDKKFDVESFYQYMKSPRYTAFLIQVQHMLENNPFLDEDAELVDEQERKKSDNNLGPTIAEIAATALGNMVARGIKSALGSSNESNKNEASEEKNDGDGDEGGDDEAAEEEEQSLAMGLVSDAASPIFEAVSKAVVQKLSPEEKNNQKALEEKMAKVAAYLRPMYPFLKPGALFLKPTVNALVTEMVKKNVGLTQEEVETVNKALSAQMENIQKKMEESKLDVEHEQYRRGHSNDLYKKWDKNIPEKNRIPQNMRMGGVRVNEEQEKVFKAVSSKNMTRKDCLNQLVNNFNTIQQIGKATDAQEQEAKKSTAGINKLNASKEAAFNAFQNINFLYFQYNHLLKDTENQDSFEYVEGEYNPDAARMTKNGQVLFFITGKFVQDAFDYSAVNIQKEKNDFLDAKKEYEDARDFYLSAYTTAIKENVNYVEYDPSVFKQTANEDYEAEEDVTWDPSVELKDGKPVSLNCLNGIVDKTERFNRKQSEIAKEEARKKGVNFVEPEKLKPRLRVEDTINNAEFLVDQKKTLPGDPPTTVNTSCGLDLLLNQIDANLVHEDEMYRKAIEKAENAIDDKYNAKISQKETEITARYNEMRTKYEQGVKDLKGQKGFDQLDEQIAFDSHYDEFKKLTIESGSAEDVKEIQKLVNGREGMAHFFRRGTKDELMDRRRSIQAAIEEKTRILKRKKLDLDTSEGNLDMLETEKKSTGLSLGILQNQKTENEKTRSMLERFLATKDNIRTYEPDQYPKELFDAAKCPESFQAISELQTLNQKAATNLYGRMFASATDPDNPNPRFKDTNYAKIDTALKNLVATRNDFYGKYSDYLRQVDKNRYKKGDDPIEGTDFAKFKEIVTLDYKHPTDELQRGMESLAGKLVNYKNMKESLDAIAGETRKILSTAQRKQADKALEALNKFEASYEVYMASLKSFEPITVQAKDDSGNHLSMSSISKAYTLEQFQENWKNADEAIDTLYANSQKQFDELKRVNDDISLQIEAGKRKVDSQEPEKEAAVDRFKINTDNVAKYQAEMKDKEAELAYLKKADELLKESIELKDIKLNDPNYQAKNSLLEQKENLENEEPEKQAERAALEAQRKSEKENVMNTDKLRLITQKHEAKKNSLETAKKNFGKIKTAVTKTIVKPGTKENPEPTTYAGFKGYLEDLSAKSEKLGKAKKVLAEKVNPVLKARKELQSAKQDDFDYMQKLVTDAVLKSKKWGVASDSKQFTAVKDALTNFIDNRHGNTNVKTDGTFVTAEEWTQKTEPVLKAIDAYLKDRDVADGGRKWTDKGQHRLDSVKALKEIILARTATLESYEAETNIISGTDATVQFKRSFEANIQKNLAQNKEAPLYDITEMHVNPEQAREKKKEENVISDDMEKFPGTISASGFSPRSLNVFKKLIAESPKPVNSVPQNVPNAQPVQQQNQPVAQGNAIHN